MVRLWGGGAMRLISIFRISVSHFFLRAKNTIRLDGYMNEPNKLYLINLIRQVMLVELSDKCDQNALYDLNHTTVGLVVVERPAC